MLGSVLRQKGYEIVSRQSSIADQRMELWMLVGRDRLLSTTLPCTLASKVSEGIYHKPIDGNNMITLTRDFYEFIYQISSCGSHSHVTREDTCARGHSFNMGHDLRSIRERWSSGTWYTPENVHDRPRGASSRFFTLKEGYDGVPGFLLPSVSYVHHDVRQRSTRGYAWRTTSANRLMQDWVL